MPPFDLCMEAIVGGASFVARSFAGDKKQLVPLLKAALKHKGTAVPRHHQPLRDLQRLRRLDQELGLGQGARGAAPGGWLRPPSARDRGRAEGRQVRPASSSTTARGSSSGALHHEEHDVTSRGSALQLLDRSHTTTSSSPACSTSIPSVPTF